MEVGPFLGGESKSVSIYFAAARAFSATTRGQGFWVVVACFFEKKHTTISPKEIIQRKDIALNKAVVTKKMNMALLKFLQGCRGRAAG